MAVRYNDADKNFHFKNLLLTGNSKVSHHVPS